MNLGIMEQIDAAQTNIIVALKDEFSQQFDGIINKLESAKNSVENQTGSMEKWADVTGKIGNDLTRNVTVPLVNMGKSAVQAYRDTESAFAGVKKTIDENKLVESFGSVEKGYEVLDKAIWDLTQETASSYEEIAGVMEWAGQLGVPLGDAGSEIIDFTKTMIMLGDTTNVEATEAAESLAKFMNITHTSFEESSNLGSAIVHLGNNFATTEDDIIRMATRLAGAGTQIGLSESEILAFSTALSSVGITAELGGTAFSKAMVKMQVAAETGYEPVIELQEKTGMTLRELELMSTNDSKAFAALASSLGLTTTEMKATIKAGNNLNDFARVANMSTEEFVRLYREDATAALQAFIVGLGNVDETGMSTISTLQEMGFTEVRLRDTLTRLSSASDLMNETLIYSNEAWGENSALVNEADKRYETLDTRIARLNERWKEMKVDIAEILVPVLEKLLNILDKLISGWQKLPEWIQKAIISFAAVAAALGPILLVVSKLLTVIINFKNLWGLLQGLKIGTSLTNIAGVISKVVSGVVGFISKISGIAAVIGGLVLAVKNFFDMWNNGWSFAKTALEAVGIALAAIGAVLLGAPALVAGVIAAIVFALSQLAIVIHDHWDEIKEWASETWKHIQEGWSKFKEDWVQGWNEFTENAKQAWENFKEAWGEFFESLKERWNKFKEDIKEKWIELGEEWHEHLEKLKNDWNAWIENIKDKWNEWTENLKQKWQEFTDNVKENWREFWSNIQQRFEEFIGNVKQKFEDFKSSTQQFFDDVKHTINEKFQEIVDKVQEWFKRVIADIQDFFAKAKQNVIDLAENFKNTIKEKFEEVVEKVKEFVDNVKQAFENFKENLKKAFDDVVEKVKEWKDRLVGFWNELVEAIKKWFEDFSKSWKELWDWFTEKLKDWKEAGKEMIHNFWEGVKEAFKPVADWFEDKFGWLIDLVENVKSKVNEARNWINDLRSNGSHASGLDYVPFNGYVAQLHEGERVLTKQENEAYNKREQNSSGDTYIFNNVKDDPYEYARQIKRMKKEMQLS